MKAYDLHLLEKAASIAEQDRPGKNQFRVIAITTDKHRKIISYAENSYEKTHPMQARYANKSELRDHADRIFLHAEIAALVKTKSKQPHTMYIVRIGRDGNIRMARPCPICMMAIKEAGVSKIVYSTYDGIKQEEV